jgi:CubicO group peptidase (beta-lactamase class C family)
MAPEFNSLRRLALGAINDRVIPGLVVAVGHKTQVRLLEAFGQRQTEPEPAPATVDTVYDLASLTKAVVTSLLVMKGVADGLLHLDRPLGDYLGMLQVRPEVTLRRVLAHAGGFPAHRKFYEHALAEPSQANRAAIVEWASSEPLAYLPGSKSIYSDLGFILLGALVEAGHVRAPGRPGRALDFPAAAPFQPGLRGSAGERASGRVSWPPGCAYRALQRARPAGLGRGP